MCKEEHKSAKEWAVILLIIDSSSGFTEIKTREGTALKEGERQAIPSLPLRPPHTYTVLLLGAHFHHFSSYFGSFDVKRLETFFGQTICSRNAMGYFLTPPLEMSPL